MIDHISKILSALYIDNFDDSVVLFLWSHTNHFKIGFVNSSANITGWSKTTATVVFAYTFILENIEPGQACLALLGHFNKSHFLGPGRPNEMGVYGIKQQLPMVKRWQKPDDEDDKM